MASLGALDRPLDRVEKLVEALEASKEASTRELSRELVRALLEFHASALARLLKIIEEQKGAEVLRTVGRDSLAGALLLLHDLHPSSVEDRVKDALEDVRPALQAHRGDVELVRITDGGVSLRLLGTCNGCPSSTSTFRGLIEDAIRKRAPEVETVDLEGLAG